MANHIDHPQATDPLVVTAPQAVHPLAAAFAQLPWYRRVDWVTALFLIITPIAALILAPAYLATQGWNWKLIFLFVVYGAMTNLIITAGYHRYLAHQAYQASKWVRVMYLLLGAAAFQGSALKWASDHRRHHQFCDTEKDPYNINRGFFYAHMGWLFMKDDPRFSGKFAPDLLKDPFIVFQHRYYGWIATLMGFGLPTLIGAALGSALGGFIFGGLLRTVVTQHTTFFINSAAHAFGTKTYGTRYSARDSWWLSFLTHGEGYHNFHHHFQADYRNGVRWFDWDPTKWFIGLLSVSGAARRLKRVSKVEIVKARLNEEGQIMVAIGAGPDRIAQMKAKTEAALLQWQDLKIEYANKKQLWTAHGAEKWAQTSQKFGHWKAEKKSEIQQARREFRKDMQVWTLTFKQSRRGSVRI